MAFSERRPPAAPGGRRSAGRSHGCAARRSGAGCARLSAPCDRRPRGAVGRRPLCSRQHWLAAHRFRGFLRMRCVLRRHCKQTTRGAGILPATGDAQPGRSEAAECWPAGRLPAPGPDGGCQGAVLGRLQLCGGWGWGAAGAVGQKCSGIAPKSLLHPGLAPSRQHAEGAPAAVLG